MVPALTPVQVALGGTRSGFEALSLPLALTESEGKLLREGVVTNHGPDCPTLAGVDNVIYSLMGNLPSLEVGAKATVEGHVVPSTECAEGVTLQVASLQRGGG